MKKLLFFLAGAVFAFICSDPSQAQVGIGTTTFTPNASSGLHINFPDKGLLLPQVDLNTYLTTIASGAQGLMVYNTSISLPSEAGVYFNTSSSTTPSWLRIPGVYAGSEAENWVAIWGPGSALKGDLNLYWDDANNRLGIGTTAPAQQLTLSGNLELPATSATAGIIYKNDRTFLHNFGFYDVFLGPGSGNLVHEGYGNVAVGEDNLSALTTGHDNTALGDYGMPSNTTGNYNVGLGSGVLLSNGSCDYNIAIGSYTLASLTEGFGDAITANIAIGHEALNNTAPSTSTDGRHNIGIGYQSLKYDSSGTDNVAIGYQSGLSSIGLSNTIAIGSYTEASSSNEVRLGSSTITSLFCQGAYAATTSSAANLFVSSTGQIMRSTAKSFSGGDVERHETEIKNLQLRLEEKDREIANIRAELEALKAIVTSIAPK